MKIAVTAKGRDMDAQVDPRFGRAEFILIIDSDGTLSEVIDNTQNRNAMGGAGIQAGKLLADRKIDVLLTGHVGPNAFKTLDAAGIKVGVEVSETVRDALNRLNANQVVFADKADVEAHW